MKSILPGALLLASLTLAACGGANDKPATQSAAPMPMPSAVQTSAPAPAVDSTGAPATGADPAAATSATPVLNPAHGQPGHRCEIPVGAPLSTAPAVGAPKELQATVPTQPQVTVTQGGSGAPIEIKTAPSGPGAMQVTPSAAPAAGGAMSGKINPPHGQPGHSCDVPVGQPLP